MSKASDKKAEKVCTLAEAIAQFVPDGSSVAMGLCLESMIPFAAGHEIIRQGKRDLTLDVTERLRAREAVMERISSLGTNLLLVRPGAVSRAGSHDSASSARAAHLPHHSRASR